MAEKEPSQRQLRVGQEIKKIITSGFCFFTSMYCFTPGDTFVMSTSFSFILPPI